MSSTDELLEKAQQQRMQRQFAAEAERRAVMVFMQMALEHDWTWKQIGDALGISDTGARRYFDRNFRGETDGSDRARRRRRGGGGVRVAARTNEATPVAAQTGVHEDSPALVGPL
jgi:hypothetical protein